MRVEEKEFIDDAAVLDDGASQMAVASVGFQFVQGLAADLNRGDVKLPSFPDAVMRIKRAIEQEDCNADKLARIVASEPALAARLLKVANSALMKRGGKPVNDLKTAISRLGHEMLHTTAVSVAVEQIFLGASRNEHRQRLRAVWRDAAHVAAIAYTLARRVPIINADEALLAGLLHNVGKLYIIMNANKYEDFFTSDAMLDEVVTSWHGEVGRAILEGWDFSEDKAAAAAEHMDLERNPSGPPNLTDIVTVAWLMSDPEAEEKYDFSRVRALTRLQLDAEKRERIMTESNDDIQALARALNG